MGASRQTIRDFVAKKIGRLKTAVIASVDIGDSTLINIPLIGDIAEDNERFQDSYLAIDDGDTGNPQLAWRRIVSANMDIGQVAINRTFDADPSADTPCYIYSLLNPDEWNESIDEAMVKLYFVEREEIDLTDSTNEADASGRYWLLPSWVQYKGMVMGMRWHNIVTGDEVPVDMFRLVEDRNGVQVRILGTQQAVATYTLVVEGLRYYPKLLQDDWGTTCPTPLWQAAVEVSAYHKIIKKYGNRFKTQYAQDIAIAERELMQMRAAVLPSLVSREYVDDEGWDGPDIDTYFSTSGWA